MGEDQGLREAQRLAQGHAAHRAPVTAVTHALACPSGRSWGEAAPRPFQLAEVCAPPGLWPRLHNPASAAAGPSSLSVPPVCP